jgi:hypothetical protein
MRSLVVTIGLLLLTTSQALAVDLVNKDNKPYNIRAISARGTVTVLIQPMSIRENICTGACRIEVKNVGSIDADYNQRISIEDGKLIRD